jgi:hypothetical protein
MTRGGTRIYATFNNQEVLREFSLPKSEGCGNEDEVFVGQHICRRREADYSTLQTMSTTIFHGLTACAIALYGQQW